MCESRAESRSAEGLRPPKRAFGSLSGWRAEGGSFLMRGWEPWRAWDPGALSLSPSRCRPRGIGTPTCSVSASPCVNSGRPLGGLVMTAT